MKHRLIVFSLLYFFVNVAYAITIYNDYKQIDLFINMAEAGKCDDASAPLFRANARKAFVWPSALPERVCVKVTTIPGGDQESKTNVIDNVSSGACHLAVRPSGKGPVLVPEFGC